MVKINNIYTYTSNMLNEYFDIYIYIQYNL